MFIKWVLHAQPEFWTQVVSQYGNLLCGDPVRSALPSVVSLLVTNLLEDNDG